MISAPLKKIVVINDISKNDLDMMQLFGNILTLPMLRLLLSKVRGRKFF